MLVKSILYILVSRIYVTLRLQLLKPFWIGQAAMNNCSPFLEKEVACLLLQRQGERSIAF